MTKQKQIPIRCSQCRKIICYIPAIYSMNIPIVCVNCHKGTPKKRRTMTLTESYTKMKKGIRKDIHPSYSFRSATEANFARILNFVKAKWKYEERVFNFYDYGYKSAPFVYIMDFEIIGKNKLFPAGYYEIKGYMDGQARKKLRRLKKHYPKEFKETTVVLYNKYKKKDIAFCQKLGYKYLLYDSLTQQFKGLIKNWE
jgi:hypothetical protein